MMTGRFRKTDLFALVGLLALLVWSPSYLAADDAARALSDGEEFVLPAPQDGDRIVFELVVREEGKKPEVVGPIGEMTRRLAVPGEVPRDAVWVEEWAYYGGVSNLSIGVLKIFGGDRAIYYGEDGLPVWYSAEDYGDLDGIHPAVIGSGTNDDQGRYRYTSVPVSASLSELLTVVTQGAPDDALTEALHHREAVYFGGAGTAGRTLNRYFDLGDSHLEVEGRGMDTVILPWMFHNRANLDFDDPPAAFSVEEWKWYHPDAAAAVGYHFGYAAKGQAPYLQIDILPRMVARGEGVELPVAAHAARWQMGNDFPRPAMERADVPFRPLAGLDEDPRPILAGLSLPVLRTLLQHEPVWSEAFEAGARVVGFDARHMAIDNGTNWTLLLLDAEDRVTIGSLRLAADDVPLRIDVHCSDLLDQNRSHCSGIDGTNAPFVCHSLHVREKVCPPEEDPLDLARMVPDPWALWATADTAGAEVVHVTFTPETDAGPVGSEMRSGAIDTFQRALLYLSGDRGEVYPHMGFTQLRAADDRAIHRWNLQDGQVDRRVVPAEPQTETAPAPLDVAAGPIAKPVGMVPASVATGGLLLIGISALVRGWGLVRLGAFGAFAALYARIADDAVLDHERRDEIMRIVRSEPGITATRLSRRLDLAWGVTAHHLERLRRAGLVVTCRDGRRRHHFAADLDHPQAYLTSGNLDYQAFLEHVAQTPGVALRDLEGRMSRSRSALSRTGSRLVRLGLVEKRRDGMTVRFYPTAVAKPPSGAESG